MLKYPKSSIKLQLFQEWTSSLAFLCERGKKSNSWKSAFKGQVQDIYTIKSPGTLPHTTMPVCSYMHMWIYGCIFLYFICLHTQTYTHPKKNKPPMIMWSPQAQHFNYKAILAQIQKMSLSHASFVCCWKYLQSLEINHTAMPIF